MKKIMSVVIIVLVTLGAIAQNETPTETGKAAKEKSTKNMQQTKRGEKAKDGEWYISPVKGKCPQCTTPVTKEGSLLCKYEPENCKKCRKQK